MLLSWQVRMTSESAKLQGYQDDQAKRHWEVAGQCELWLLPFAQAAQAGQAVTD